MNKTKILTGFAALAAVWLVAILVTGPAGNFPLNDDWNYGHAVKTLLEEGRLRFTCWTLAASLTNVFGGGLFALISGFSFDSLRAFTLSMGLVGACFLLLLLLDSGAPVLIAALGAVVLLADPLYFNMSFTFMNDVPFLSLAIVLTWFLCKMLPGGKAPAKVSIAVATLASVLLCLSRQIGIIIPLSFALVWLCSRGKKSEILPALVPLAVTVAAMSLFQWWLSTTPTVFFSYKTEEAFLRQQLSEGIWHIAIEGLLNLLRAVIYLGLFLLPYSIVIAVHLFSFLEKKTRIFHIVLFSEVFIALGALLVSRGSIMPLADNILFDCGLGPVLMPHSSWPGSLPIMIGLTFAGVIGAGLLVANLVAQSLYIKEGKKTGRQFECESLLAFNMTFLGLYLFVICARGFFDRYLIVAMPFLMAAMSCSFSISNKDVYQFKGANLFSMIAAAISCALLLVFSVAGTHDYMEWNRARWRALTYLTDELHVDFMNIDGGLEFNGWMSYQKNAPKEAIVYEPSMTHANDYIVSTDKAEGYEPIKAFEFQRWLPDAATGQVIASKKLAQTSSETTAK